MKGQAFITFEDQDQAQRALELNGTGLLQKKIEVKLSHTSSNTSLAKKLDKNEFEEYLNKRKLEKESRRKTQKELPAQIKRQKVNLSNTPPNKILLIQGLPSEITSAEVEHHFKIFRGFIEVRLVAVRKVAFVEYDNEKNAISAKESSLDWEIKGEKPSVDYAKK
ncbi:hypothetical protein WICMUC_000409 [Wickerhamomyces mucosus]|uniref:RRM domain-containing protein n=1 Tax=Wickerhamomyces mucosus TaxID=1378264 RepID=A0A9P8PXI9_9ASCO|nr:hypothetical protein WICMUC_000409 [Wickerhamomyces mucosus]